MMNQPAPYPGDRPSMGVDTYPLRRVFTDAIGRSLSGQLVIQPLDRVENGSAIVSPVKFNAMVSAGKLEIDLPAGRYQVSGMLSGAELGANAREFFVVTLPEEV